MSFHDVESQAPKMIDHKRTEKEAKKFLGGLFMAPNLKAAAGYGHEQADISTKDKNSTNKR